MVVWEWVDQCMQNVGHFQEKVVVHVIVHWHHFVLMVEEVQLLLEVVELAQVLVLSLVVNLQDEE